MNAIIATLLIFAMLNVAAYFYAAHVFKFARQGLSFLNKSYETITTKCITIPDYDDTVKVLKDYDIVGVEEFLDARSKYFSIIAVAFLLNILMLLYPIAPVLNDSWVGYLLIGALVMFNADSIILHRNFIKVKRMIDYRCELYNQLIIAYEEEESVEIFYKHFIDQVNKLANSEEDKPNDNTKS
jgi:hypothetical protein